MTNTTRMDRSKWILGLSLLVAAPQFAGCSGCSDDGRGDGGGITSGDVPRIAIDPFDTTLPSVAVGGETFGDFTITNIGGETLHLTGASLRSDSDEFSVGELAVAELEPEESTVIRVVYKPSNPGSDEAILLIASDALNANEGQAKIDTQILAGGLVAVPPELDFQSVPFGETKLLFTDIINTGGAALDLTYIGMTEDTSQDFRITQIRKAAGQDPSEADFEPVSGTVDLGPWERVRIDVEYRPIGGNDDVGAVLLHTSEESTPNFIVGLAGSEPAPAVFLLPSRIDFGPTPAEGATKTFLIRSVGNSPLIVESVAQARPPHPAFTLSDLPEPGAAFINGADHEVTVTFVPPVSDEQQFTLVGVETNDPAQPTATLEILGRLDAPIISVNPPLIHFGAPAAGLEVRREITISNVGTKTLTITGLQTVEGQTHADFDLISDLRLPLDIEPGGSEVFEAKFEVSAADGQREGLIEVVSSDPFRPIVEIILRGLNGGTPRCDVIAAARQQTFGLVGYGREKILPIRFISTGTVDCEIVSVELQPAGFVLPGADADESFRIAEMPNPMVVPLQGEAVTRVGFRPEEAGFLGLEFPSKSADLVLTYTGPNPAGGDERRELRVRLEGQGGESELAVLPSRLDFGLVTLGCLSQTMLVTVYNTGIAETPITSIELRGCGPEFEIVDRPELPVTVVPARPVPIHVRYGPQNLGPDACELVISAGGAANGDEVQEIAVPVNGEGTRFSEQTDEYVQTSGQEVDVLFVVDNSGSMSDEQNNLADNISRFTAAAELWDNDYQLGVVHTELGGDAIFGGNDASPDRGKLLGNPRIVTPAHDRGRFEDNVQVGDNGAGAQESGLEAARLALSPERLHEEPRGACDQCVDGEECVNNACVGFNRGFLRENAALELVFLSDEEDQSPARVSFYIDFFKSIKGFRNEGLLHASAIVGPRNVGCQSNFGSADAGDRYIDVVDATGGTFHSICVQDYGPALDSIGDRAFGLRVQFFLSRVPDPQTLTVTVEGRAVDEGWAWDEGSNSVIFDDDTVPQPGDHVEIHYTAFCFR
jgi:hypothetical protein